MSTSPPELALDQADAILARRVATDRHGVEWEARITRHGETFGVWYIMTPPGHGRDAALVSARPVTFQNLTLTVLDALGVGAPGSRYLGEASPVLHAEIVADMFSEIECLDADPPLGSLLMDVQNRDLPTPGGERPIGDELFP